MKTIKIALVGLSLAAATSLFAANTEHNHATVNHASSQASSMAYHNEMMTRDDFKVVLATQKPFVNGSNEVEIMI